MAENIGVSQIKERDSRIDIVRVIAMLCIVMHHCIVNDFGLQQILKRGGVLEDIVIFKLLCLLLEIL